MWILLTLSRRIRASAGIGAHVLVSATPAAPNQLPCGPDTYAVAPGATFDGPATAPSRIRCSPGRRDACVASRGHGLVTCEKKDGRVACEKKARSMAITIPSAATGATINHSNHW